MIKISSSKRKELMIALCKAIATLNKPDEVAEFLLDFLSPKENETIAKRLRIAELLAKNKNYQDIRTEVHVGFSTIARVNTWLNLSGKGFKLVLERKKTEPNQENVEEKYDFYSWSNIKRRYSMYFWPQLLLEELMNKSNNKEKKKIMDIFQNLHFKKKTFSKEANKILYNEFNDTVNKFKTTR